MPVPVNCTLYSFMRDHRSSLNVGQTACRAGLGPSAKPSSDQQCLELTPLVLSMLWLGADAGNHVPGLDVPGLDAGRKSAQA
jgi:hypothetical protein